MTRPILMLIILIGFVFPAAGSAQDRQTLVVFAASSLTDAFSEIGAAFEAEHPETEILFNFAGSSTLAAQLAEGAPADVFASANGVQMQTAREAGRIAAQAVEPFVYNRLVLAVPAGNPAHIQSLQDLIAPGLLLVVASPEVPIRTYTDLVLDELSASAFFGADYRGAVAANIVSEETNVRQILAKLALGEADAGFVYQSDITPDIAHRVTALPVPAEINPLALYPIAVVDDSEQAALARAFVDFVLSARGQTIMSKWGFLPVDVAGNAEDSSAAEVSEHGACSR